MLLLLQGYWQAIVDAITGAGDVPIIYAAALRSINAQETDTVHAQPIKTIKR